MCGQAWHTGLCASTRDMQFVLTRELAMHGMPVGMDEMLGSD